MSAEELVPGLRRIVAPNPSPMTERGTNTYLLGERDVVLIDPGPDQNAHLAAIEGSLAGARLRLILVTHAHLDHSALCPRLAEKTGAEVLAAGDALWGRSEIMARLAAELGGGEGRDTAFQPDRQIADGEVLESEAGPIGVLHTPGHMANHLSFAWNGALFSGDLVMGWSTSLVSPPDGDMTAFFASLARLQAREDRVFYPGHGAPVPEPQAYCAKLIAHRRGREASILAGLARGPATAAELAAEIYTDLAPALMPMAERNVLAHLINLLETGRVTCPEPPRSGSRFQLR